MSDVHQAQEALRVEIKRLNKRVELGEARIKALELAVNGAPTPPAPEAPAAAAPAVAAPGGVRSFEALMAGLAELLAPVFTGGPVTSEAPTEPPAAAAPALPVSPEENLFPGPVAAFTQVDKDVSGPAQSTAAVGPAVAKAAPVKPKGR